MTLNVENTKSTSACFDVEANIRPELKEMDPYVPIVPYDVLAERLGRDVSEIIKLDANENPYGPSPRVAEALSTAKYYNIYPDPESTSLRKSISQYIGIPHENILVGAGADELIDLIFRLFVLHPSEVANNNNNSNKLKVVNFPPTFGMYKFDADVNGAQVVNFYRDAGDFSIDVAAVERYFAENAHTSTGDTTTLPKILFVTSPNNPDGSEISDDDLRRLCALPVLVVLDEAYIEFSDKDRSRWVIDSGYTNLVVLRTFSKWMGLAGLRVGYGIFPQGIIKHLWKIKQPYNVNVAAQLAAQASLEDAADLVVKLNKMIATRDEFIANVSKRYSAWLKPWPSQSNFVLCKVIGTSYNKKSALQIKQQLAAKGILIRYYSSKGLADCVRFSMGTPDQMVALYAALDEIANT